MKRILVILLVLFCGWMTADRVRAELFGGVEFPDGTVSFADAVVRFDPGSYVTNSCMNTALALGAPNYKGIDDCSTFVSLGNGGSLVLQFTDNSLTTSGDSHADLWIFEIGGAVEATDVYISQDGRTWISVGRVGGSVSGVDIDAYIGRGVVLGQRYTYVKLVDDEDQSYQTEMYAGADIDAVGAISSAAPVQQTCSQQQLDAAYQQGYEAGLQACGGSAVHILTGISGVGVPDSNFSLLTPGNSTAQTLVGLAPYNGSPDPSWINPSTGAWIGPENGNQYPNSPPAGIYVYTTHFTLQSLSGVLLAGQWASDNTMVVTLNGHAITTSANASTFDALNAFTVSDSTYFNLGTNELRFEVTNEGSAVYPDRSPTGLYVNAYVFSKNSGCAAFHFESNTLHVPCVDIGIPSRFWIDLKLTPSGFTLTDWGQNTD
jgi:hypothetical protein